MKASNTHADIMYLTDSKTNLDRTEAQLTDDPNVIMFDGRDVSNNGELRGKLLQQNIKSYLQKNPALTFYDYLTTKTNYTNTKKGKQFCDYNLKKNFISNTKIFLKTEAAKAHFEKFFNDLVPSE